jgi:hypothetical protein
VAVRRKAEHVEKDVRFVREKDQLRVKEKRKEKRREKLKREKDQPLVRESLFSVNEDVRGAVEPVVASISDFKLVINSNS